MIKTKKYLMILTLIMFLPVYFAEASSNQYGSQYDDTLLLKPIRFIFETAGIGGKVFSFRGRISAQCKSDGCWFKLKDDTNEVLVDLKPYDFRIPSDISGTTIKLNGKVNKQNGKVKLDAISVVVLQ